MTGWWCWQMYGWTSQTSWTTYTTCSGVRHGACSSPHTHVHTKIRMLSAFGVWSCLCLVMRNCSVLACKIKQPCKASQRHAQRNQLAPASCPINMSRALLVFPLLAVFSGVSIVPSMFVLMGSFHSRAGSSSGSSASASSYSSAAGGSGRGGAGAGAGGVAGGSAAGEVSMGVMRELYTQLAHLIDQYPRIKVRVNAHCCLPSA